VSSKISQPKEKKGTDMNKEIEKMAGSETEKTFSTGPTGDTAIFHNYMQGEADNLIDDAILNEGEIYNLSSDERRDIAKKFFYLFRLFSSEQPTFLTSSFSDDE
jgi:hypothetical protein